MKYDEFLKKESARKSRATPRHEESHIQIQMVNWFRLQYPSYIIAAIPNGGRRNAVEAKIMKGEGVLAGFSDLIVVAFNSILLLRLRPKKESRAHHRKSFSLM